MVPRSVCSAVRIVTVSVGGTEVSNDGEGPVVGWATVGLRSTTDGDGVAAVPSPPHAEAKK